jgi:ribosomal protein L14
VVRSQSYYAKGGDLIYNFFQNNLVLLKKRMNVRGGEVCGPACKNLKIKKFRINFSFVY